MLLLPMTTNEQWAWFRRRTHVIACEDSQGIVAITPAGKIAGGVVFDSFTVKSCNVHVAIDNPMCLRHGLFEAVAAHGFLTCGKDRFFGLVPSNNRRAVKLNKSIGFRVVAHVPDAVDDGVGYVVMRLDRADCRFLPAQMREAA